MPSRSLRTPRGSTPASLCVSPLAVGHSHVGKVTCKTCFLACDSKTVI